MKVTAKIVTPKWAKDGATLLEVTPEGGKPFYFGQAKIIALLAVIPTLKEFAAMDLAEDEAEAPAPVKPVKATRTVKPAPAAPARATKPAPAAPAKPDVDSILESFRAQIASQLAALAKK